MGAHYFTGTLKVAEFLGPFKSEVKTQGNEGGNLLDKRWEGKRILPGNTRRQQERQSMRQKEEGEREEGFAQGGI